MKFFRISHFIATLHSKHIFWDSWDNIFSDFGTHPRITFAFEPVLQGCRNTLAGRLPKYNDHQTLNLNDCMNKSQRKCFFYNVLVSIQLCSHTLCEYSTTYVLLQYNLQRHVDGLGVQLVPIPLVSSIFIITFSPYLYVYTS